MKELDRPYRHKERALWQLLRAPARKGHQIYPPFLKFDVLDVDLDELEALGHLARKAEVTPEELAEAEDVIGRVVFDRKPLTCEAFCEMFAVNVPRLAA